MDLIDKNTYFELIKSFEIIPLTQSEGWYRMHSYFHPNRIVFFVNNIEEPTIACFAHTKKMLWVKMLLIEGECYLNQSAEETTNVKNFYSEIKKMGYDILETASNAEYRFEYETAMRQTGFLRPVGLFSLPSTKIIQLDKDIEFNNIWKKNLRKAYKKELSLEIVDKMNLKDSDDFMKIYLNMSNRKALHVPFCKEQIKELCSTDSFKTFFVSNSGNRITAAIIYIHKNTAVLLYAATNDVARTLSASFFMYYELFEYLKSNGINYFDLGKLLPSIDGSNNVFLFKNGIDGTHIQLNGEWAWYKKTFYRAMMYFVKKYLMKKREI